MASRIVDFPRPFAETRTTVSGKLSSRRWEILLKFRSSRRETRMTFPVRWKDDTTEVAALTVHMLRYQLRFNRQATEGVLCWPTTRQFLRFLRPRSPNRASNSETSHELCCAECRAVPPLVAAARPGQARPALCAFTISNSIMNSRTHTSPVVPISCNKLPRLRPVRFVRIKDHHHLQWPPEGHPQTSRKTLRRRYNDLTHNSIR